MKKNILKVFIFFLILGLFLSFTSIVFAADTVEEDEDILSLYEFTGADAYLLTQPAVCYVTSVWFAYVYDPNEEDWYGPYMYGPFGGSGFCANPDTGTIVTAGHMVDTSYVDLKWDILDQYIWDAYPDYYYGLTNSDWNWIYDNYKVEGSADPEPDREVWVQFNTANSSIPDSPGDTFMRAEVINFSPWEQRDIAVIKVTPITGRALSSAIIGDSSKVSVQDKVTIIGYPWTSDIGQDNPLNPTVTTGSISGKVMLGGTQVLQVQGDARPGNSGGPVLDSEEGSVIGIITMGTDYTNNYLRPSNDIKGLLGVENKLGIVDDEWRKGLVMYNNSHYSESIKYFDAVLNLSAGHLLAQEYKAKAQANMGSDIPYEAKTEEAVTEVQVVGEEEAVTEEKEEEPAGLSMTVIILSIVLPVIFVGLVAVIIVLLVKRKGKTEPSAEKESVSSKKAKGKSKVKGMYCSSCGAKVEKGQKYCNNCGNKL
jgi:V8-like Glu-specific endopeptidase